MMYHSINFYSENIFNKEGYYDFLKNELSPFLQSFKINNPELKFFFVRYIDERGPHLRIRLRNIDVADIEKAIRKEQRIVVTEYHPEYERYGGHDKIHVSEEVFESSSQIMLYLAENTEKLFYENGLLFSVAINVYLIRLNRIANFEKIIENSIVFWNDQTLKIEQTQLFEKLNNDFLLKREVVFRSIMLAIDIVESIIEKGKLMILEKLVDLRSEQIETIIESLIHMNNNRFGVFNFDEVLTNYYLLQFCSNEYE